MPSKVCPQCGRPTDANFCSVCGVATVIPQPAPAPAQQTVLKNSAATAGAIFIAISYILLAGLAFTGLITFSQLITIGSIVLGFSITWFILPGVIEYAIRKARGEK